MNDIFNENVTSLFGAILAVGAASMLAVLMLEFIDLIIERLKRG